MARAGRRSLQKRASLVARGSEDVINSVQEIWNSAEGQTARDHRKNNETMAARASAILGERHRHVNKLSIALHRGIRAFGILLAVCGIAVEIVALARQGGGRTIGLVLTMCGWELALLSLAGRFTGGYEQQRRVLILFRHGGLGLSLCVCSGFLGALNYASFPDELPCSGANGTQQNATRVCDDIDLMQTHAFGVTFFSLLVAYSMLRFTFNARSSIALATTPRKVGNELWACTRGLLVGTLIMNALRLRDTISARVQFGQYLTHELRVDIALTTVSLLSYIIATPLVRHRLLQYAWGFNVASESSEAASIALQMAGKEVIARTGALSDTATTTELRNLLNKAKQCFRALPFQRLNLGSFTGKHAGLERSTWECALGDCDAFISHSWRDDGACRWSALRDWATAFQRFNKRAPLVWIDSTLACPAARAR